MEVFEIKVIVSQVSIFDYLILAKRREKDIVATNDQSVS